MGGAVKDFKKSIREDEEKSALNQPKTIDADVKNSEPVSSVKG